MTTQRRPNALARSLVVSVFPVPAGPAGAPATPHDAHPPPAEADPPPAEAQAAAPEPVQEQPAKKRKLFDRLRR